MENKKHSLIRDTWLAGLNDLNVNQTSTLMAVSQKKTERAENWRRNPMKMQGRLPRKSQPLLMTTTRKESSMER